MIISAINVVNYDRLHLSVVTPEGEVFTDEVDMVNVPGSEGKLGILPNHVPVFTRIVPGELQIRKGEKLIPMAVAGGFVDILPGKVTILTETAVRAEEIDILRAEEARKRAEQAMKEKRSGRDFAVAEASLRRALLELRIARKYRKVRET